MKKLLALMLALVMAVSLASCGGGEKKDDAKATEAKTESKPKLSLGKKVSTDVFDFTLEKAKFSYYASSKLGTYAEPTNKKDVSFRTSKGQVFVCLSFKIKNKDRDTWSVGDYGADYPFEFELTYKGKKDSLYNYNPDSKRQLDHLSVQYAGVFNGKDWTYYYRGQEFEYGYDQNDVHYYSAWIDSGDTYEFRVPALAYLDPDSLDDPFEITVNVRNSDGEDEYFTYEVK